MFLAAMSVTVHVTRCDIQQLYCEEIIYEAIYIANERERTKIQEILWTKILQYHNCLLHYPPSERGSPRDRLFLTHNLN